MTIPHRPDDEDRVYLYKRIDHEHAVAKRAVEALREIARMNDSEGGVLLMSRGDAEAEAAEALDEITASGWQP